MIFLSLRRGERLMAVVGRGRRCGLVALFMAGEIAGPTRVEV